LWKGFGDVQANDIEDVDAVLDEIAEQNDQMSQIQGALAQSTVPGMIDDDDLEAELNVRCTALPSSACRLLCAVFFPAK
jgi:hypothetical protein